MVVMKSMYWKPHRSTTSDSKVARDGFAERSSIMLRANSCTVSPLKNIFFLLCKIINKNIDIQIEKYIPDMFPPPPAPIVCNSCTNHFMLWSMPALVLGWGDVHLVDGWGEEHLVVGGELYKGFGFFVPPAKI